MTHTEREKESEEGESNPPARAARGLGQLLSWGSAVGLLDSGKEAGTTPIWKPQGPSRRRA